MDLEPQDNQRTNIRLGADAIDWLARCGYVQAEKYSVIENGGQEQYFLTVTDEDFGNYVVNNSTGSLKANNGITPWTSPVIKIDDHRLDIVKGARRYGLMSNYRYSKMPDVYSALNRLNETSWSVNKGLLLELSASLTAPNAVCPSRIDDEDRKLSLIHI